MLIGIVHGGTSTECEISTRNACAVQSALVRRGYDTCMIPYDGALFAALARQRVDIVFPCVQGKGHGDGTLQGILDFMGVPYVGSGMTAAALINDKILCKKLFVFHGHQTPAWTTLCREAYFSGAFDPSALPYPFVAKAPSQGGSFGIQLIRDASALPLMAEVFRYDGEILLEAYAEGTFATVGLWPGPEGMLALPCVEGVALSDAPQDGLTLFLNDFDVRPSALSAQTQARLQRIALDVFRECGARDYARVDFIVSADETRLDVLEINAVPGLKEKSLYPRAAAYAGIAHDDLIEGILQSAIRRWKSCFEI